MAVLGTRAGEQSLLGSPGRTEGAGQGARGATPGRPVGPGCP